MPDVREKLVELLGSVACNGNGESLGSCPDRKYGRCREAANLSYCVIQNTANHLIANGVTFETDNNVGSKWIPVTDRLPDAELRELLDEYDRADGLEVIVTIRGATRSTVLRYLGDNVFVDEQGDSYPVSCWMPLPKTMGAE